MPRPRRARHDHGRDHGRDHRARERAQSPRRSRKRIEAPGLREDPRPQPAHLRGPLGVCAAATAWTCRAARSPSAASPSASSPRSRSASRARSSRCARSTSAARASRSVEESEIKAKAAGTVEHHEPAVESRTRGHKSVVLNRNGEICLVDAPRARDRPLRGPDRRSRCWSRTARRSSRQQLCHGTRTTCRSWPRSPAGPLRGHRSRARRSRSSATAAGRRAQAGHRAQGRPAPADHHRGQERQGPRALPDPREGRTSRSTTARRSPPAGDLLAKSRARSAARRTSPAACRA